MTKAPTWFAVARRPKWIGAFFIAMGIAVICALLAQWQAGRSIEAPVRATDISTAWREAPRLDTVVKPGRVPRLAAVGTLVQTSATLDTSRFWVVANRIQRDGTKGFWVVGTYSDSAGNRVLAPLGFTRERGRALAVARHLTGSIVPMVLLPIHGRLSPAEAPEQIGPVLQSLSLGQLANLLPADAGARLYPLFLLVTDRAAAGLQPITVTSLSKAQVNWLSAFYAAEWTAFCGFSFFMWWRLVRDQQQRELEELAASRSAPTRKPQED
jgi:surfeit locus 1 family protein